MTVGEPEGAASDGGAGSPVSETGSARSTRPGTDQAQQLAAFYDDEARVYEELWAPVLLAPGRELVAALALTRARLVVDLGTGPGTLLPVIQASAPQAMVLGLDRSLGMVGRAAAGFPRAVMDAAALGVRAGSCDAVVMAFVLFHLHDPDRALAEARRILRPGSVLGVATWGRDHTCPALDGCTEALDEVGALADPCPPQHGLVDEPTKLAQLLERAQFDHVRSWTSTIQHQETAEGFLRRISTGGGTRRRLDTLGSDARQAFLARAEQLVTRLPASAFRTRREVVFATAQRPAAR